MLIQYDLVNSLREIRLCAPTIQGADIWHHRNDPPQSSRQRWKGTLRRIEESSESEVEIVVLSEEGIGRREQEYWIDSEYFTSERGKPENAGFHPRRASTSGDARGCGCWNIGEIRDTSRTAHGKPEKWWFPRAGHRRREMRVGASEYQIDSDYGPLIQIRAHRGMSDSARSRVRTWRPKLHVKPSNK
ncbi:hypothetical protein B0H14DRAFT_2630586 [Mycena olivaceomarginata]|nr:hypothetical protein B0H14DRAFT_2630586 [Mycena olivaceomarginata]